MKLSSLVLMMFLFSCSDSPPPISANAINGFTRSIYSIPYQVIEADSCEYILFGSSAASWGGHRARCKYCLQRNKLK